MGVAISLKFIWKKIIIITVCTFTWFVVRICMECNLWQYYLYTGHEIEKIMLDIDNRKFYNNHKQKLNN